MTISFREHYYAIALEICESLSLNMKTINVLLLLISENEESYCSSGLEMSLMSNMWTEMTELGPIDISALRFSIYAH